jgi:NADH-quinone oxidoreductase subunit N
MNYAGLFQAVLPETIVVLTAFLALALDLVWLRRHSLAGRRAAAVAVAVSGCVLSGVCLAAGSHVGVFCGGVLVIDALSQLVKLVLLCLTAFTAIVLADSEFTEHLGEFVALLLLATAAMMFLVSSEDLLMIFLSLEMTSLCLYVMTAFNKRSPRSAEAGLKYFLFGGTAAAVLLFGLSLLYGITGQTNLREMAARLGGLRLEPVFFLALVMTVVGFGFKIAAVPFHLWAADAYQGAPAPAAALIAAGSKVASFFVLARLMITGLGGAHGAASAQGFMPGWVPLLACLAVLSMLLGNLAAIVQTSVRRLLAFSAVAQAGYVLVGLLAGGSTGMASVMFYSATYGVTLVGAFSVVGLVESRTGGDGLECFAGLGRRAPVLAACLMVFLLSLAGIPPLAGFFGKVYLFTAALHSEPEHLGLLWLVVFAIAMSAVSLYYYLQVLKQVYVTNPPEPASSLKIPVASRVAVSLMALLVVLLGVLPGLLLGPLLAAIERAGY